MAALDDILGSGDLLLTVADYLDVPTLHTVVRLNRRIYIAAKAVERHLCRIVSRQCYQPKLHFQDIVSAKSKNSYVQKLIEGCQQDGLFTLRGLSCSVLLEFVTVLSFLKEEPNHPNHISRDMFRPYRPARHLCYIALNPDYQHMRPIDDRWEAGLRRFGLWTEQPNFKTAADALQLLQRLSRVASRLPLCLPHPVTGAIAFSNASECFNVFRRSSNATKGALRELRLRFLERLRMLDSALAVAIETDEDLLCIAMSRLAGPSYFSRACSSLQPCSACTNTRASILLAIRLAILRDESPASILSLYRVRGLLSDTNWERDQSIEQCIIPQRYIYGVRARVSALATRLWRKILLRASVFRPREKRPPPFGPGRVLARRLQHSAKSRRLLQSSGAKTAPQSLDLFDPWTLWWFLDGDDANRGVRLLWRAWQQGHDTRTAADAPAGCLHDVVEGMGRSESWFSSRGFDWRRVFPDIPAWGSWSRSTTRYTCTSTASCRDAWRATSPAGRSIESEAGKRLMLALNLKAFTGAPLQSI